MISKPKPTLISEIYNLGKNLIIIKSVQFVSGKVSCLDKKIAKVMTDVKTNTEEHKLL
jgi:hypothetical protein